MKQINIIRSAGLIPFLSARRAQEAAKQWSLEECIRYAIENNIDLKQRELEQKSQLKWTLHHPVKINSWLVPSVKCQCG